MTLYVTLDKGMVSFSPEDATIPAIIQSKQYKIRIRRYVSSTEPNKILFKKDLSYLAMQRAIDAFALCAKELGFELVVDSLIRDYIDNREMFLVARSKLGIEIKQHDEKLTERFAAFESVVNEQLERKLRDRQMWDAFFMTSMKKASNFSVPGSGKTSSVYACFAYLSSIGKTKRILVVSPKSAFGPWIDEFKQCFGAKRELNTFCIHDAGYSSSAAKKSALRYECGNVNLLLFNYESVKTYKDEIKGIVADDTLLVFDEVHKIKRIGGEYASAAIEIAADASYVIAMTGTPIPNTYQDIFNLLHILYGNEYDDFFGFTTQALKNPSPATAQQVNDKLRPFFCRTTKEQLQVPPPNSDMVLPVYVTSDEENILNVLLKKYKKNKLLLMLRILQLESDAKQLLNAIDLSEFSYVLDDDVEVDEIDYANYSDEILDLINSQGLSSKTMQCLSLVRGLVAQGKPVVVWCIYVDTIRHLTDLLNNAGVSACSVFGSVGLDQRTELLDGFKSQKYQVLVTNPNTLAESVSLHGICHDAVYFEYSFNLVHLLQSKDRIHRLGLPNDQYTQFYYLQPVFKSPEGYYSMSEHIYERLKEKERVMLQAIEGGVLETQPTTEEELDAIFQQVLQ